MDAERISYEVLQDLVRAERRSNRLSPVQARFWSDLRAFLEDIKAAFREEQQKDPFSRRAMMARDEAQHALQAAESLWSLRERKMALYALAQPKEGAVERPEGLTAEEIDLYDRFVQTLRDGKAEVFGEAARPVPVQPAPTRPSPPPTPTAEPSAQAPAPPEPAPEPAPAAEPSKPASEPVPPDLHEPPEDEEDSEAERESAPTPAPPPAPAAPRTVPADTPTEELLTIRALGDIPPFVGPDMQTYLLREGDFAMVPPAIAKLLEKRGKAEVMEQAA